MGAQCSPTDADDGVCCTSDCRIKTGTLCFEQSECIAASVCSAEGKCVSDGSTRPANSICQSGVVGCKPGGCSGLCNAVGECSR